MSSRSHHFKDKPFRQLDVPLDKIEVRPGRRAIIQKKADNLAISMREEGLNFPILLSDRLGPESRVLIAGRHRLEAARKLEWLKIPAFVVEMTETEERLREISDNLFRAELTVLERSKQIAEWVRLTGKALSVEEDQPEVLVQVEAKPQGGRPEGGARAAARELGIDRNEVRRADKIDSITEEAQEAAVEAGLDDNQAALLKIAAAAPEKQVEVLAGITARKAEKKTKAKAKAPPTIELGASEYTVEPNLAELVNALHRAVAEPFVNDLGPLFIGFVKAHPGLEADAITSLHSALDGVETMCRKMREPLMDAEDARLAAKQSESVETPPPVVEVELDRSAPWKSLPAVEASQATPRHSTLNMKDYLPGLLSPGAAATAEAEAADDTPQARADRRRAAKEAQKVAA
jgi:ParB family chromosome partitioning protein